MPSLRIVQSEADQVYFVTLTVIEWINIFTKEVYFEILHDNLVFYQKKLNAKIYAYVFMTNHIHILFSCDNAIKFIQNYKSFTTKQVLKELHNDNRTYLLRILKNSFTRKPGSSIQIWQQNNYPRLVESSKFFDQKIDYIHQNPVRAGYVREQNHWKYSSANQYFGDFDDLVTITLFDE